MDSALAWVGQIAEWVGRFFPRWVVLDVTEGGVKYVGYFLPRGLRVRWGGFDGEMRVQILGPGLHWYWPASTTMHQHPTARQADNLPTQTIVTTDDKCVAVSGMLVYEVEDLGLFVTKTFSPMHLVQDISLTAIHDVCCNLSWEELKTKQQKSTLDTALKNAAQKSLAVYGIKVIKCMLTDLSITRVLRLIQTTSQDA